MPLVFFFPLFSPVISFIIFFFTYRSFSFLLLLRFCVTVCVPVFFSPSPSSSSSLEDDQEYLASMASLSSSFGRRLGIGLSLSLGVAVGGNLGGITSFLLGLNDGMSRMLKLDVVYPIQGFKRCLEKDFGKFSHSLSPSPS